MENIKVSVLIYVLNDYAHIEKCVRSVMEQSLRELEILIIDGGSTDGTLEILHQLGKEDSRIRLVNSGAGVGVQFNTGLRMAVGKYIGICESDDYILPNMYEQQYKVAEEYKLDVLKANAMRFCEKDKKEYSFPFMLSTNTSIYDALLYPQEDFCLLTLGVNGFWTGLYNREFLLSNNIFMNETRGASYQDITFSFLTELYAERAYVMSDAFYYYRMDNPNSSVNNPKKITILDEEYQLLKMQLKQRKLWEKYKEIYWKWRTEGSFWFYDNMSDEMRIEYIPLLYNNLKNELKEENYQGTDLDKNGQELCKVGLQTFDEFKHYVDVYDNTYKQEVQRLEKFNMDNEIVIFGTGNLGVLVNSYLELNNKSASASIDNDSSKWNKILNGNLILSPEEGVKRYPKASYVIANAVHFQEMKRQLVQSGIREENIIICNHYDLFLKNMLVKRIREAI